MVGWWWEERKELGRVIEWASDRSQAGQITYRDEQRGGLDGRNAQALLAFPAFVSAWHVDDEPVGHRAAQPHRQHHAHHIVGQFVLPVAVDELGARDDHHRPREDGQRDAADKESKVERVVHGGHLEAEVRKHEQLAQKGADFEEPATCDLGL